MNIARKPKALRPAGEAAVSEAPAVETPPQRKLGQRLRRPLLVLGPLLVLLAGGYFYVTGGRYVSTENAYIRARKVAISAQISGPIVAINVKENPAVKKGEVLFSIDPEPFRVAVQRAEAQMQKARHELIALKASYRQKQEQLQVAHANLVYARSEFDRQTNLVKKKIISASKYDEAKRNFDVARRNLDALRFELTQILASLGGDPDLPRDRYPAYLSAKAEWEKAALELRYTLVRAPFDGYASKVPEPGQYVRAGTPVMSVVDGAGMWIEANFRETDLTHVRPGQTVTITVDTYPGRSWTGRIASISRASVSEFSVLPAQNASGNWVKVVQRIPIRIAIDHRASDPALRAGMSTSVEIDTEHRRFNLGWFGTTSQAGTAAAAPAK
ncbi:MAG: HlyD family secretion protein [Alphaproteobacteria bacterium]